MPETTLDKLFRTMTEGNTDASLAEEIGRISAGRDKVELPAELMGADDATSEQNATALIRSLTIPQKIKLALFGNQVARAILIRDTYRQIPMFVLENARITENEIQDYSRNTNLDDTVFRAISNNSTWMKSYPVKLNLCSNPKVPIDVSLKWVKHLQSQDMRRLARSKNIPQVIASQCKKIVEQQGKKRSVE